MSTVAMHVEDFLDQNAAMVLRNNFRNISSASHKYAGTSSLKSSSRKPVRRI
jgi:hypothetical protein